MLYYPLGGSSLLTVFRVVAPLPPSLRSPCPEGRQLDPEQIRRGVQAAVLEGAVCGYWVLLEYLGAHAEVAGAGEGIEEVNTGQALASFRWTWKSLSINLVAETHRRVAHVHGARISSATSRIMGRQALISCALSCSSRQLITLKILLWQPISPDF